MLTEEGIATVPMVAVELVAAMGGGAIVADAVRVIVGGEELDTDYLLVKSENAEDAKQALASAGHAFLA